MSYYFLRLTKGAVTQVDHNTYYAVYGYKWHLTSHGYAARSERCCGKKKMIYLHRHILGAKKGQQVDHINGDKLDNRKENLRIVSSSQNLQNKKYGGSSKFKGVHYRKDVKSWRVTIQVDGKTKHIGYFKDELEAAKAYDRVAKTIYGEGPWLNNV